MNLKPPYKPIKQLPYHCVPACLMMVLDRRKVKHGSQEDIGYELGMVVPQKVAHEFKKMRTGRKPIAGYGTQVASKRYSINRFFKKHGIILKETYYPPGKVKDYTQFIVDNIRKSNDLMVCFENELLFGAGNWGHVCLVQGIESDVITLIDPERKSSKKRKVKILDLVNAINKHGKKRRGGFWVISK